MERRPERVEPVKLRYFAGLSADQLRSYLKPANYNAALDYNNAAELTLAVIPLPEKLGGARVAGLQCRQPPGDRAFEGHDTLPRAARPDRRSMAPS